MSSPAKKQPSRQALSQVSLFADVRDNEAACTALFNLMSEKSYRAGDVIIEEGDAGTEFFILAEGTAAVFKKTQDGDELYKVAILSGHMGAFFGESALLEADTRTATIRAETDCRCLILEKEGFDLFCDQHPKWAMPILKRVTKTIMNRLKKMNQDLSLLYRALMDEFSQN